MCEPATIGLALGASASSAAAVGTLAYAAAGSAALSAYQGEKTRKAQSQANTQARTDADMAMNKANPKLPNVTDLAASNMNAMGRGAGSTMLTGAGGAVTPGALLGRTSLLGG